MDEIGFIKNQFMNVGKILQFNIFYRPKKHHKYNSKTIGEF